MDGVDVICNAEEECACGEEVIEVDRADTWEVEDVEEEGGDEATIELDCPCTKTDATTSINHASIQQAANARRGAGKLSMWINGRESDSRQDRGQRR